MQKEGKKGQLCDIGLWKYTRHPNYFGEWMVWNSLCIVAAQAIINLTTELYIKLLIGSILVIISITMWKCLTVWTGAAPAEYFSV